MTWQDMVIAAGQWIFLLALLPSILGKDKPAFATSILTAVILVVFAVTYATLALWVSTVTTLLVSGAWLTLAVQKHGMNRREKNKETQGAQ